MATRRARFDAVAMLRRWMAGERLSALAAESGITTSSLESVLRAAGLARDGELWPCRYETEEDEDAWEALTVAVQAQVGAELNAALENEEEDRCTGT